MKPPRFSLLLPTCNRLSLLRQAVSSIRDQAFGDFEIVISDNASEEDIGSYVREVGDARIVYARSDDRLDVTDNWNRALGLSSGELILMLGDDDGLARGYLSRLDRLARETEAEAIYTGAFLLTYPGVNERFPRGELRPYGYARFMQTGGEVRSLPYAERRDHVRTMLGAHVSFGFNMQFLLFTRTFTERLANFGPFFQSLFPDYYAMVACFLEAERLVSFRRDGVFIGVSPKSYGFYYQNRKENDGAAFLHNSPGDSNPENLPGSHIVTGWQDAAQTIVRRFGDKHRLETDPRTFRLRQIVHNAQALHEGRSEQISPEFLPRLRVGERALWSVLTAPVVGRRLTPRLAHRLRLVPFTWDPEPLTTSVASLDEARALPATFIE